MNTTQKKEGFTLIETIMYIALIAIMLGALLSFSLQMLDSGAKSQTNQQVYSEARYGSERLLYEIRNASGINVASSSFGVDLATTTGSMLSLSESSSTTNPTTITVVSGILTITQGSAAPVALNSGLTRVANLVFSNYSTGTYNNVGFVLSLAAAGKGGGGSSSGSYSYIRPITVTSNTSIASGTQSSFPMLVSSTLAAFEPVSKGGHIQNLVTAPNGGQEPADLVFASDSGCSSLLNFETESYSSSTGALIDWVNVPTMQAGKVIYACYGNSAITTDQSHPAATWNANYKGVYQLSNGTTLNANDSTGNGHNGSITNAVAAAGKIGGGAGLSGSSAYINCGSNVSDFKFTASQSFTDEAWIYPTNSGSIWQDVFSYSRDSSPWHGIWISDSNQWIFGIDGGNIYGSAVTFNTWNHLVMVQVGGVGEYIYLNGSLVATGSAGDVNGSGTCVIGGVAGEYFTGTVDEVRISGAALSSSWVATEYNNQANPGTFYVVGSETNASGTGSSAGAVVRNEYQASTTVEGSAELRSK